MPKVLQPCVSNDTKIQTLRDTYVLYINQFHNVTELNRSKTHHTSAIQSCSLLYWHNDVWGLRPTF